LTIGRAPFNYISNMPHDGWRLFLPYWIDMYKHGKPSITKEGIMGWYRKNPASLCYGGATTGNTASQLQIEFDPAEVAQDKIFFSALLTGSASVQVTVGGVPVPITWDNIPNGGIGVWHGSASYSYNRGEVVISLARGVTIAEIRGPAISSVCDGGFSNWNAWVGSASGPSIAAVSPILSIDEQQCIQGTAPGNFKGLCEFSCAYGYCPVGACVCLALGPPRELPQPTGVKGYPIAGEGSSYIGLCSFACNYGYCPLNACGTVPVPLTEPTVSPFLPPACRSGSGEGSFAGLCSFSCNYGFCPMRRCTCTGIGALVDAPPRNTSIKGHYTDQNTDDEGLCNFACQHGYCPDTCSFTRVDPPEPSDPGPSDPEPSDPDDVCKAEDGTYSTEPVAPGSHMDWYLMLPEYAASTGRQYITIVNLTPHRFKLDHTHSYQMDVFDFDDIPQGRARQNIAHYTEKTGANPVDTNGEAYYNIDGTDKKFVVRATTHIPDTCPRRTVVDLSGMGLGQREYLVPEQETPVTLVITGSNTRGFITSLTHGPGNWMHQLYDVIKDRQIRHIVMPGTHNSGMSTISGHILSGGSVTNTQNQALNIYDQLRAGARWFDLRIASIHQTTPNEGQYGFWALHVDKERVEVVIGNTGEGLSDIIEEINRFTDENSGEVIFFRLKYLLGIRKVPSLGPIDWGQDIIDDFFYQLKKVNNRCGNLDVSESFEKRKASFFMDQNNGKGCVVFILNGHLKPEIWSIDDGIYNASSMRFLDYWSNKPDTESMADAEIMEWNKVPRSGVNDEKDDQVFIAQWLVSAKPITTQEYGLQNLAIKPTNPALYWAGVNNMSPEKWPNVLMVDYIGVIVKDMFDWASLGAELYTLAIGLNLYMISENCGISKRRSPLLPAPSSPLMANIYSSNRLTDMTKPWNGIIFANGTVLENPPPTLHPGRVEILKNGTVFNNGTVLEKSIPNPDFMSTSV
jgi:hypothetical protein